MSSEKQDRTSEEIEFWSKYGLWPKPEQLKKKGGKRQGAGRPKLPQVKKRVTISLKPELIARLKGENKNQLIERLLVQYFRSIENE